jgi:hypothetical protein
VAGLGRAVSCPCAGARALRTLGRLTHGSLRASCALHASAIPAAYVVQRCRGVATSTNGINYTVVSLDVVGANAQVDWCVGPGRGFFIRRCGARGGGRT